MKLRLNRDIGIQDFSVLARTIFKSYFVLLFPMAPCDTHVWRRRPQTLAPKKYPGSERPGRYRGEGDGSLNNFLYHTTSPAPLYFLELDGFAYK